jgi:hypothetical protein
MPKRPWLITECLRSALSALDEHRQLRVHVLGTILGLTLLCIALAAFGVTFTLPKGAPEAYSPRLFAVLFLPAEFYLYDLILTGTPRPGVGPMYLDMRFARLLWAGVRLTLMGGVVFLALALLSGLALAPLKYMGSGGFFAVGLLVVIWLLILVLMLALSVRLLFLPVVVALREPSPLKTLYRATKGKTWRLAKVLCWPYTALMAISVAIVLIGPLLERNLGFVALAPWFLVDACLTALICCASAVLLALVYRNFVAPQPETGAAAQGEDGTAHTVSQPPFSA